MKSKYLEEFKHKTKSELVSIITNSAKYNSHELEAAHELLRKKTTTFSEYQELTGGKTATAEISRSDRKLLNTNDSDKSFLDILLIILKWIGIIIFFPMSLVVIGYYKNKKAKKEYYANNRPHSKRTD
ncbi:hypothetical protein IMCC3317_10270 [Kordia antarctica]|uniref:Uncharacterized protein n=1 Tax=Kordia antarctica TaxID=1218801 RepID=A0A7L4ZGN7_9FLAO|nr:hypothetical protein [Kordia antarctica]QHI35680.1 hypothetical protein IMCC3317_10270 [Kordia antarctica]